ncbi:AAA family ATPase [Criblamydia sequanensis]|uniref:MoxR-like ATPase n=1 Tax=Candidatus Criblamydia sequanensis CRIB-18 TaxID=1437425 RepID=A0A090E1A5_9BACT|nr:MoxR family ATPase [Criblamydia sequanensis]CDR34549.1 MoxR-like ATPase [Criblamydia sequanensis CRIB-18]
MQTDETDLSSHFENARKEMAKVIVGQKHVIDNLFIALVSSGHVLLEGLPGLAKTLIATTLAKVVSLEYKRIQFTPDLLPADLIGQTIFNPKEGTFSIRKGPIFTNVLLADEINRAPAKVQSALLEIMQERQVTISNETFKAGSPYIVLATQNPIEQEGTYPLPEAQLDRFLLKVKIDYPSIKEEKSILEKNKLKEIPKVESILSKETILKAQDVVDNLYIDEKILDYILSIVFATREPKKYNLNLEHLILYGASPRASIALKNSAKANAFLANRNYVTPLDVKQVAYPVLRHRLRRTYEAEAEGVTPDHIIDEILKKLPVP